MAKVKWENVPHSFTVKVCHYSACSKCGLVFMKNEFSEWARKMGCNHKEHPTYQTMRKVTNPFAD